MRRHSRWALVVVAAVRMAASTVRADVWDLADDNDNVVNAEHTTDNTLVHGVEQRHDLAGVGPVGDLDWYRVFSNGRSSYEAVVDDVTGGLNLTDDDVLLIDTDGATPIERSGTRDGVNVLRWQNPSALDEVDFVLVQGAACNSGCTVDDQYRIRFYETTYTIPRFNNSGNQSTILTLAATGSVPCAFTLLFLDSAGDLLGPVSGVLEERKTHVRNTAQLSFAAGRSGSIVITHTCGYGGISGKAIAVEPATGFAFDTPLQPRIL